MGIGFGFGGGIEGGGIAEMLIYMFGLFAGCGCLMWFAA